MRQRASYKNVRMLLTAGKALIFRITHIDNMPWILAHDSTAEDRVTVRKLLEWSSAADRVNPVKTYWVRGGKERALMNRGVYAC